MTILLPTERISKVKPLLDYFLPKFQLLHILTPGLSLDETMIKVECCGWLRSRPIIQETPQSMEFWSGWLVKVKVDTYATLRFTPWGEGKKLGNNIIGSNHILGHGAMLPRQLWSWCVSTSEILLKNKTRICWTIGENHGLRNQFKEKSEGRNDILKEGGSRSYMERQEASMHSVSSSWHHHSIIGQEDRRTGRHITNPTGTLEYNKYIKELINPSVSGKL